MKKIVTHKKPHHLDDWLSVSYMKSIFPLAKVEYISPQEVPPQYYTDPKICLIDIGMQFSPEYNNFDHHQEEKLPCSLILVLNFYGKAEHIDNLAVKIIDLLDRYGFQNTVKLTGYKFSKESEYQRKILTLTDPDKFYAEITEAFLKAVNTTQDYSEFIKTIYNHLDSQNILNESKEIYENETASLATKIQNATLHNIDEMKVLLSYKSFAPYHSKVFQQTKVDIIVEPNNMNEKQTSIIRNSYSPLVKCINLEKIFSIYKKAFLHNTGFFAVVDIPINRFNLNFLNICLEKKTFNKKAPSP